MDVPQDYPKIEFYKHFPAEELVEGTDLTAAQYGARRRITDHLCLETPPGVCRCDLTQLRKWSGMLEEEWKHNRIAILDGWLFHAPTLTLHHAKIKATYADYYHMVMLGRAYGKRGGPSKGRGKNGVKADAYLPPPQPPRIPPPYPPLKDGILLINSENWGQIQEILNKNKPSAGPLWGGVEGGVNQQGSSNTTNNGSTPTPASAEGGVGSDPVSNEVRDWLASQSDTYLDMLKVVFDQRNPKHLYCQFKPRKSLSLAFELKKIDDEEPGKNRSAMGVGQ